MRPNKGCCEGEKTSPDMMSMGCCSRESARTALFSKAKSLRDQAHQLERLADELPGLSNDSEEILWQIVQQYRAH